MDKVAEIKAKVAEIKAVLERLKVDEERVAIEYTAYGDARSKRGLISNISHDWVYLRHSSATYNQHHIRIDGIKSIRATRGVRKHGVLLYPVYWEESPYAVREDGAGVDVMATLQRMLQGYAA
jgi:hypothetical protein